MRLTLAFLLLALPAQADTEKVIADHIMPGFDALTGATADLAGAAAADCSPAAVRPEWNAAFDAWLGVQHLHFGPLEQGGRAQAIAFWPDERDFTGRALRALLAGTDPLTPEAMADASVAARGLFALERLLYETGAGPRRCEAIRALSDDLARTAEAVDADWDAYAETMRTAGEPGNTTYLSPAEVDAAIYTMLQAGLDFIETQRLGGPMGTFDRPRPNRAEARRSGRSLRNVILSLQALREMTADFAADIPRTLAAFDDAIATAEDLDDPVLAGVADPMGRFRVEALQAKVATIRTAAEEEIGKGLGISQGFNAGDGD